MTELYADMAALKVTKTETLTSGAAGAFLAHFSFSHAWDGMAKTAVFRPASCDCPTEVLLGADETCAIPWEVLRHPRTTLMAGVYGTRDGTIRLPTVWASLGTVQPGAGQGIPARPPAPDVYQQLLGLIGDLAALETTAKDSLVGAVNEVFNMGGGGARSTYTRRTRPPPCGASNTTWAKNAPTSSPLTALETASSATWITTAATSCASASQCPSAGTPILLRRNFS